MGESARWRFIEDADEHGRRFASYQEMAKNKLYFQLCAKYTMFPSFYEKTHMYHPVEVTYKIGQLGKTSYNLIDEARSVITGELLHSAVHVQVTVDKETRRPAMLPDWFKAKYEKHIHGISWKYSPKEKPSEKMYSFPYRVVWSDTDYYYHVNQSSYIRFCLDAIAEAGMEGRLKDINRDIGQVKVKEMRMLYAAETKPHEELNIHVWQDDVNLKTVHCEIEKESKPKYHFSVDFY